MRGKHGVALAGLAGPGWSRLGLVLVMLSVGSVGCSGRSAGADGDSRKIVVATTTMIADLASEIGGPDVRVIGLMKPGMDPHIYQPTPADSVAFSKADLILVNGLHLEGRMMDMIQAAGGKALELGRHPGIRLRQTASAAAPDPHVWWNVRYFKLFAEQVRDALKQIDPAHAAAYDQRAADYLAALDELDSWVTASVRTIQPNARYMITSHDAFYYFGEAYGLELDAVLGISTDAQARAGEQDRLARIVAERKIPAVFHETSVSQAQNELVNGIVQLARDKYGHTVRVAGPLYSDSLGDMESGAATYISAVRANTRMIVEALGGRVAPLPQPSMGPAATQTAPAR
ncbi:MAG TPA: zinc ABC transporter substrate-binding protein [Phycisphaerae bacterium]|jgi:ABC-type Zn uptake system ZnuABC Zn-binding protein ZnuA|nr:zinc ABC transporter solute-binding protein [Phycisphaerae bacterium]HOB72973.1 zinc ABC transporter substrate-binding protein [Phycisphaerae bacterium]HOJ52978.1 zinc ABC transporter substrate-binding protein [Phycisphaerae bacterium]HOL24715.1 zinc ABC transporter substrate-binding protein [Phycisphaerae bacterium]HPP19251.1 zinc ABC transporter substrate-binding protein [Phycisphaerae bacterium]